MGQTVLNKEVFLEGIRKLKVEYGSIGFEMTEEKETQWYAYLRSLSDSEYKKRIKDCLLTCNHVPTMADVYNAYIEETLVRRILE